MRVLTGVGVVVGLWRPEMGYWSSGSAAIACGVTSRLLLTSAGAWKVVDCGLTSVLVSFEELVVLGGAGVFVSVWVGWVWRRDDKRAAEG
ncbi:DUF417 family protein [Plesiomonas shigelloides]|uniref:DUF417 family protein n=1 Tax=Plesiomonas shigelloides TaxID=703 RepID=UPI002E32F8D7|nr:DUF417 family protein [Plesiomonas shigelloides]